MHGASSMVAGVVIAATTSGILARQQQPAGSELREVSGYVMSADGAPIASGTVRFQHSGGQTDTPIAHGRFQFSQPVAGTYTVRVSAPDHMSRRLVVTVPRSGGLLLPSIRLTPASYVRLRLAPPPGQRVTVPRIVRESYTSTGTRLPNEPGDRGSDRVEEDGAVTIGPLPRGIVVMALDSGPFARMLLPDLRVTGDDPLIEVGPVRVDGGTAVEVLVVDEADTPVPGHDVILDNGVARSPFRFTLEHTDSHGVVTFGRLAAGRYKLHAQAVHRCQGYLQSVTAGIDVPAVGRVRRRFPIGGSVFTVRAITGGASLLSTRMTITQEAIVPRMAAWLRKPVGTPTMRQQLLKQAMSSECAGTTGRDGRVTLTRVPQGVARVSVLLPNSSWSREITVPGQPAEIPLEVPTAILPVHVIGGGAPVGRAIVTWTAAGGYVTATTTPTGDALLEGIADGGGVLSVRAPGFLAYEEQLTAPPGVHHQVSLVRAPDTTVRVQVVTDGGAPASGVVVQLLPRDPIEDWRVTATDGDGTAVFRDVPPAGFRIEAWVDGQPMAVASVQKPKDNGEPVVLTLRSR